MLFTVAEALSKTLTKSLQKAAGVVSTTLAHAFFATLLVGLVQVVVGYIMARKQGHKIIDTPQNILGACLFGFFALVITVLGFGTFVYNGDIGVSVFLITLSIVPGAIFDRIFFKHSINIRQWTGVILGIFAGYVILGMPSLKEIANFPVWVWMSLGIALMLAVNQAITQKIQKIDPFVKNFWGGIVQLIFGGIGVIILGSDFFSGISRGNLIALSVISTLVGIVAVFMWMFNLMAYQRGGAIALKNLVMNGSYLVTAMVAGIIFFGEPSSAEKSMGAGLYIVAFALFDPSTWRTLSSMRLHRA